MVLYFRFVYHLPSSRFFYPALLFLAFMFETYNYHLLFVVFFSRQIKSFLILLYHRLVGVSGILAGKVVNDPDLSKQPS